MNTKLIQQLHADLRASLEAEATAEGHLTHDAVERHARWWLLIAVENYSLDWWDFLPGDSPEDACRAFALAFASMKQTRAPKEDTQRGTAAVLGASSPSARLTA